MLGEAELCVQGDHREVIEEVEVLLVLALLLGHLLEILVQDFEAQVGQDLLYQAVDAPDHLFVFTILALPGHLDEGRLQEALSLLGVEL